MFSSRLRSMLLVVMAMMLLIAAPAIAGETPFDPGGPPDPNKGGGGGPSPGAFSIIFPVLIDSVYFRVLAGGAVVLLVTSGMWVAFRVVRRLVIRVTLAALGFTVIGRGLRAGAGLLAASKPLVGRFLAGAAGSAGVATGHRLVRHAMGSRSAPSRSRGYSRRPSYRR